MDNDTLKSKPIDFLVSLQKVDDLYTRILVVQLGLTFQTEPFTNKYPAHELNHYFREAMYAMRICVANAKPAGLTSQLPRPISSVKKTPKNGIGLYDDGKRVIVRSKGIDYTLATGHRSEMDWPLYSAAIKVQNSEAFLDPSTWYDVLLPNKQKETNS